MTADTQPLTSSLIDGIRDLADRVSAEDGAPALTDQALSHLRLDSDVVHVTVQDEDGHVHGYAQLDGDAAEVVAERGEALADTLDAVIDAATTPALRIWSHGRHSRLAPVLAARGASEDRRLHQLRRPLGDVPPAPPTPDGIAITGFEVGRDEAGWLRVNAAAFAHHPEQGQWRLPDLVAREAEPWFDPRGFLLARRGDRIAGFHWTKIHPAAVGEVYVIGVDPAEQGSGLGAVLLQRGLEYLQGRGCQAVMLYVDESNAGAMRLYARSGFEQYDLDVQWTVPVAGPAGR